MCVCADGTLTLTAALGAPPPARPPPAPRDPWQDAGTLLLACTSCAPVLPRPPPLVHALYGASPFAFSLVAIPCAGASSDIFSEWAETEVFARPGVCTCEPPRAVWSDQSRVKVLKAGAPRHPVFPSRYLSSVSRQLASDGIWGTSCFIAIFSAVSPAGRERCSRKIRKTAAFRQICSHTGASLCHRETARETGRVRPHTYTLLSH